MIKSAYYYEFGVFGEHLYKVDRANLDLPDDTAEEKEIKEVKLKRYNNCLEECVLNAGWRPLNCISYKEWKLLLIKWKKLHGKGCPDMHKVIKHKDKYWFSDEWYKEVEIEGNGF